MNFSTTGLIVKISSSDLARSQVFYERILGFQLDPRYSITNPQANDHPYLQLNLIDGMGATICIGLYEDISKPYDPMPESGTVPSFLVEDIDSTLTYFLNNNVVIDKVGEDYIITNESNQGFIDKFFFFRDPDNNSLVIRQNMN